MLSPDIVLTEDHLRDVTDYFLRQDAFVFDVESWGPNRGVPHLNNLSWMSLATHRKCVVIPFGHPIGSKIIGTRIEQVPYKTGSKTGQTFNRKHPVYEAPPKQLERDLVFDVLAPLFNSTHIIKGAHNAPFDLASVTKYLPAPPVPPFQCTLTNTWLLNENLKRLGLKYLTRDIFGYQYDDEEVGRHIEDYPFDMVAKYSYADARYAWLIMQYTCQEIEAQGLTEVHAMESALVEVLMHIRLTGSAVDLATLESLKTELAQRIERDKAAVYKAAGVQHFNINSVAQKRHFLFDPPEKGGQGLKPLKQTKGGALSTDDSVLQKYSGNKLCKALLQYQETSKMLGTYVIGYLGDPAQPDKKPCLIYDGRIYADFVQYGTVSGRFSCREPNLQNIPRPDTELGKIIRGIWVAEPGNRLIVADFGQIELAVLAHYCGQGKLFEGFHLGIDPHQMTAAMVLDKDPSDVSKKERQHFGKSINFAVVYGAGLEKVADMAQVGVRRAQKILEKHAKEFPEIYEYKGYLLAQARRDEFITTISGRKRRLPDINSDEGGYRAYSERQAFNSLIQGSAADIQKWAMLQVFHHEKRTDDIKMLMTVHDELVMSAPGAKADLTADILREGMTGGTLQSILTVPLSVDINIVDRWSDAK
jgi:DNA polymerase I-like protein with 3'-5' exonuclease and polymerase domains